MKPQPQRSEPPDCIFCGRPPHPDSSGHSYRPREQPPATDDKQDIQAYDKIWKRGQWWISETDHNAALKEARLEEIAQCRAISHDEICRLQDAVSSEREKHQREMLAKDQSLDFADERHEKDSDALLQAQAAIAERKARIAHLNGVVHDWQDFGRKLSKILDGVTTDEWLESAEKLAAMRTLPVDALRLVTSISSIPKDHGF